MDDKHRKILKMLRVGRELLVLMDITILTNKPSENNTSWFTDREMTAMLLLLRDPIYKRIEECAKEEMRQKKRKKHGVVKKTTDPPAPVKINGERLKVGLQFRGHSVGRTCMIPKERHMALPEGSSHSGGSCDSMILFPEKLHVIVRENRDNEMSSCQRMEEETSQPTSSYFSSAANGNGDRSAKRKKLTLKRIISSSRLRSSSKVTAVSGGFEVDTSQESEVYKAGSSEMENVAQSIEEETSLPSEFGCTERTYPGYDLNGPPESSSGEMVGKQPDDESIYLREEGDLEGEGNSPLQQGNTHGEEGKSQLDKGEHPRGGIDCSPRVEGLSWEQDDCPSRKENDADADVEETCVDRVKVIVNEDEVDGDILKRDDVGQKRCDTDGEYFLGDVSSNDPDNESIGSCLSPLLENSESDAADDDSIDSADWSPVLSGRQCMKSTGRNNRAGTEGEEAFNLEPDNCANRSSSPHVTDAEDSPGRNSIDQKKGKASKPADEVSVSEFIPSSENILRNTGDMMVGSGKDKMNSRTAQRSKKDNPPEVVFSEDTRMLNGDAQDDSSNHSAVFDAGTQNKGLGNIAAGHLMDKDDRTGLELNSGVGEGSPQSRDKEDPVPSLPSGDRRKRRLSMQMRNSNRTLRLSSSDEEDLVSFDLSCILRETRTGPQQKRRKLGNRSRNRKLGTISAVEPNGGLETASAMEPDVVECRASSSSDEVSLPATSFLVSERGDPAKMIGNEDMEGDECPTADDLVNGGNVSQNIDRERQKKDEEENRLEQGRVASSGDSSDEFLATRKEIIDHRGTNDSSCQSKGGKQLRDNSRSLDEVVDENKNVQYSVEEEDLLSVPVSEPYYHQTDEYSHFQESDGSLHMTDERGSVFVGQRNVVFNLSKGKYYDDVGRNRGNLVNSVVSGTKPEGILEDQSYSRVDNNIDACTTRVTLSKDPRERENSLSAEHSQISKERIDSEESTCKTQTERQIETFDLTDTKDVGEVKCSQLDKGSSGRQKFFQEQSYENAGDQDFVASKKPSKKIKKKPLKVNNSLQSSNTAFGSLKRFDDSASKRPGSKKRKNNRRESQIEVNPENLDKWWMKSSHTKEKKRTSEVIDLVAVEERMEASLKSVTSVSNLAEDQLQFITQQNEGYLREIFRGKRPSQRHTEYKSSAALRARMTYLVSYGDFSEESLETIMDALVPMFCRKGSSKYLDYVSKVLLPELLVKICMDVLHVSYEEAEKMF